MTNTEALQIVKDLIEYCRTNSIIELRADESSAPLLGDGMTTKKITKIEYIIQAVETGISPEIINEQLQTIDSQINDLVVQKDVIVKMRAKVNALQQ